MHFCNVFLKRNDWNGFCNLNDICIVQDFCAKFAAGVIDMKQKAASVSSCTVNGNIIVDLNILSYFRASPDKKVNICEPYSSLWQFKPEK